MGRLQVLNNVDHHDLHIRLGHGAAWGDAVNLVLVFPTEYEEVQREYPILIRKDAEGAWQAAAMLGFELNENLFLKDGGWDARYVPAVRRLEPFRLAFPEARPGEPPAADPIVQIDPDHPRISRDEGAPLFRSAGGHAPYLEHMIRILRAVHVGVEIVQPMFTAFERHGLIEPARMEITLHDGARINVPDVYAIGREPLARLSAEALAELHRAGFLRLAFMLSASLANVPHLIDRQARTGPRGAPA
ncbi:MAG: SapC family protein [Caulobacteraceae bacterium]|nr:SapC family protein [Caulobacter sp.]